MSPYAIDSLPCRCAYGTNVMCMDACHSVIIGLTSNKISRIVAYSIHDSLPSYSYSLAISSSPICSSVLLLMYAIISPSHIIAPLLLPLPSCDTMCKYQYHRTWMRRRKKSACINLRVAALCYARRNALCDDTRNAISSPLWYATHARII